MGNTMMLNSIHVSIYRKLFVLEFSVHDNHYRNWYCSCNFTTISNNENYFIFFFVESQPFDFLTVYSFMPLNLQL